MLCHSKIASEDVSGRYQRFDLAYIDVSFLSQRLLCIL